MKLFLILAVVGTAATQAKVDRSRVVYGVDDRVEVFEANYRMRELAKSTAGMIFSSKLIKTKNGSILPPFTLNEVAGVCSSERFESQPIPFVCTGFLVGPDLLVTAGHCVSNKERCSSVSWVFDFKVDPNSKQAPIMVNKNNIYKCKEVIDAEYEGFIDYSLIKLDRPVKGRKPLITRTNGKIKMGTDLAVIGHPTGLPTKVVEGAKVVENKFHEFFQSNLDTFGGNSGSPVFDSSSGTVEGILVRGAKDYEMSDEGCDVVHKTTQNITDFGKYGEGVSRITEIKTLKYRWAFLKAAQTGNVDKLKTIVPKVKNISYIYDNGLNTALHLAAKNNKKEVIKFLLEKGVNIDAYNEDGNTALHFAAEAGSQTAVAKLIEAGADVWAKNNFGQTALDKASLMSFGIKLMLDKAMNNSKKRALVLARD